MPTIILITVPINIRNNGGVLGTDAGVGVGVEIVVISVKVPFFAGAVPISPSGLESSISAMSIGLVSPGEPTTWKFSSTTEPVEPSGIASPICGVAIIMVCLSSPNCRCVQAEVKSSFLMLVRLKTPSL